MTYEIVISGISGRFPESDNMDEFSQNLFNKVILLTEDNRRWEPGLFNLPKKMGQLKDLSKFDNEYFGVPNKQAQVFDPQLRILLELTYESIVDAGYNPEEFRGSNVGVFVGNSSAESHEMICQDPKKISGYTMPGSWKSMFPNRISYAFDFKGPSFIMDTACSSSALALYEAVRAIQNNECESAIVGAANLCLKPETSLELYRLNATSDDGLCKPFDASADGYGRSEAIVAIFLQKSIVARRNYASVVHIKTNTDGYKEQGPFFPSALAQKKLLKEVYEECKINPLQVCYVEAHGTGTPAGDPVEMSVISEIFCNGREGPLLVGSVKSNMGHSECSSGLCSVAKLIICMEKSLISPNLHFHIPNPDIKPLIDGKVKVVTIPTKLEGEYTAMNSFGIGGVNVHAVLKSNRTTEKPRQMKELSIPQLTLYSGRTEEGVQYLFDYIQNKIPQREFFALLNKSAYSSAKGKPYRGYQLLFKEQTITEIKKQKPGYRPIWYIFSGMGSQWPCMAKELMNLEVFANSIRNSAEILKPYGLDLIDLLTNRVIDERDSRRVVPAFVCISAVQIALVDVLKEIAVLPDGIIGHSLGELGCAYADGCFTAEQMLLSAYWRGKVVEDSDLETGSMAALGLSWSQAEKCCPRNVFPSCHNAEDSVTISGLKDSVKMFVDDLKSKNVFVREVDACGYAFHSQYILPAAEKLKAALEKVIPHPMLRTSRWISSAYRKEEWNDPQSKLASSSYFVHNLVSPVLFYEALLHVPKNAIVIEIAPHHLLQAILKRVIGHDTEYISLMKRNVDNKVHLLSSIGRLYNAGLNPDIQKLYPQVQFPVPKGTPMISPLIKWDHSVSWMVAKWDKNFNQMVTEINIDSDESPDKYILDHCINGKCIYPATGYLVLAWKALAEIKGKDFMSLPVIFEDVKFTRATVLSKSASTNLLVEITTGGYFEINESGNPVCSGRVYSQESVKTDTSSLLQSKDFKSFPMKQNEIYKEFKLRGYDYGPTFQGLVAADIEGKSGLLKWNKEWVAFLDTALQITILASRSRTLRLLTGIQGIKIDPIHHKSVTASILKDYNGLPVLNDENTNRIISVGVEFKGIKYNTIAMNHGIQNPILEEYSFIPYFETKILCKSDEETLERYSNVCSSMAKRILDLFGNNRYQIPELIHGFEEADETLINIYLKSHSDNHILFSSLLHILNNSTSEDLIQHTKTQINSYQTKWENEIFSLTFLREDKLRTMMDIVLENTFSKKVNVIELVETTLFVSIKMNEIFQSLGVSNISYTIAHSKPDLLQMNNLPLKNFALSTWDPKSVLNFQDADLCIMKFLSFSNQELHEIFENVLKALRDNGFLLLIVRTRLVPAEKFLSTVGETVLPIHSEYELEKIFSNLNVHVICKKSDSFASTMYLLRKSTNMAFQDVVVHIKEDKYEKWVNELSNQITKASNTYDLKKRIWLVSEGTKRTGIIGLVNCLRKEPGGYSIRCIFTSNDIPKLPEFNLQNMFYQEVLQKNLTMNVFMRGSLGSFRHLKITEGHETCETNHAYLNILTKGDLSSLMWVDSELKYFQETANKAICHVYYAPLNFKDIMVSSGRLTINSVQDELVPEDCHIGLEFSGLLKNGERVMGMVSSKSLATTVVIDPYLLWKVPDGWSLEEASTVPVAYATAYYALIIRGNLRKGEKVLIHSGSGGVGQAAIAIALSLNCKVFTTVGSFDKRGFLRQRFTELKEENFCNSRDTTFEQHILNATDGKGVDVILNSLADEKLLASLNCLAKHGRFLEIGKYDIMKNNKLGLAIFSKNTAFHGILLDCFTEKCGNIEVKKKLMQMISDGIATGVVKPLPSTIFEKDQAEQAFRYMANGRHIGKVVIKIRDEKRQKDIFPTPIKLKALSRTTCDPDYSYIIIGGLGGFGLELCNWLIERGARHVVLTSRSGIKTGYQKFCMNRWKQSNIDVVVSNLNVSNPEEAKELLKMSAKIKPVKAIFNLALVLKDAFMENQTVQMFKEVCESKVSSTLNLDVASREFCPEIQWFVCFSSMSCGRGNAGQSNYAFANSAMERICEERKNEGLPGLAIQWGAIGEVGVLEKIVESHTVIADTVPQRINSCLKVMDKFLNQDNPVVSSFIPWQPLQTSIGIDSKRNLLSTVGNILGIKDMSVINQEASLGEFGMDSLTGTEIKQCLERDFNIVLGIPELRLLKVKELKEFQETSQLASDIESSGYKSTHIPNDFTSNKIRAIAEKTAGYFSFISSESLVPNDTIIKMNSVEAGVPIFIIHPIDGVVTMLNSLAQEINFPVYGVQCTPEAPSESIEQLASWYWKHIKVLNFNSNICLVGYSFGACVAFEMCLQAELHPQQHAKVSNIIMLDGSPGLVTVTTRTHRSHFQSANMKEFQVQALCSYVSLFLEVNMNDFKQELLSLPSLDDCIDKSLDLISSAYNNLKVEDLKSAFDLYYKKVVMSLEYIPKENLKKEVTLIKASDSTYITEYLSENYDLEKICDGKITLHSVKGTHQSFFQGRGAKEICNFLNSILS